MLRLEKLIYALLSLNLVLVLGSGISYGAFLLLKQMATYASFSYPVILLLVSSFIILLICFVTPVIAQNFTSSDSVVKRLRQSE